MNRVVINFIAVVLSALCVSVLSWGPVQASNVKEVSFQNEAADYRLSFYNTHTGEELTVRYRKGFGYDRKAIEKVNHLLRDHRNGHVHEIDGRLLDLLHDIKMTLEARDRDLDVKFNIISGYRSPESNEMLRSK